MKNSQTVVIAEKEVHALFMHTLGIRATFMTRDEFTAGALKRLRFNSLLDFNGLNQPLLEELPHYSFEQTVEHTLFKDKKIKTGAPCIKLNGTIEDSRFFNAIGYPPKPAWTQYHEMTAKLFPELSFQADSKGFPYKYPKLDNQTEHSRSYGFIPCGSLKSKHWPISRFIELAARLEGEGYKIHFYLGASETDYAEDIAGKLTDPAIEVNLSLQELAINLQQHKIVIANDCGPMHIAAVIGCPLIAIFRDTLPQCWFPYQKVNQIAIGGQIHKVYRGGRAGLSWPEVAEVKNSADNLTKILPKSGRISGSPLEYVLPLR
jgi:ADP-heptose:LPS heptosyltransferase